jgi:hypothetical protein
VHDQRLDASLLEIALEIGDVASDVARDGLGPLAALADAAEQDAVGDNGGGDVDLGPVVDGGEDLAVGGARLVEEVEGAGGGGGGGVEDAGEVAAGDGLDVGELGCLVELVAHGGVGAAAFDELLGFSLAWGLFVMVMCGKRGWEG